MANVEILVYLSSDGQKVKRCVQALLEYTSSACSITFFGECLPKPVIRHISTFCNKSNRANVSFTNYTMRVGYNEAMLRTLQTVKTSHIITMSDDIVVTKNWVSKLFACLMSESCLGIVCPFINGGIRHNICATLPFGFNTDAIAEFLDKKSKREYPRITSAEACLLIKKAVLDKINIKSFKVKSYLEPELCHEARRYGFNVAIANDAFVYCDKPDRPPYIGDDEKFYRSNPLWKFRQSLVKPHGKDKSVRSQVEEVSIPPSKSIKIFSPSDSDTIHGKWWGDYWAREHLNDSFKKQGWGVNSPNEKADVSLLLRGSINYPSDSSTKIVWIYSHPGDSESKSFLSEFNYVYTLSHKHAEKLKGIRSDTRVLLPASSKVYQQSKIINKPYDILVVGNSAKASRVQMVKHLIATGKYRIGIVGSMWESHVDSTHIIAPYWDNERYSDLFDQASMTIYTHADDMRDMDFVAIRVLDTIASSDCFVICDKNKGLDTLGLGDIPQFSTFEQLEQLVDHYLECPQECIEKMSNWRQIIQQYHTFDQRVEQIISDLKRPQFTPVTSYAITTPQRSVAVYLSTLHPLCYNMNIKFSRGVTESFKELGFDAYLIHDTQVLEREHFDIVFCAAPSFQQDFKHQSDTTYIMYQSEQCPREDIYCERASGFWEVVSKELPKYDFIFEPFEDHIQLFQGLGYNNVVQFRVGYHPTFDFGYPEEDKYDVIFIGHPAGEIMRRRYILTRLEENLKANKIRYFMPPTDKGYGVFGDQYSKILFSSKISLNIHFTHLRYFEYHKLIVDSFCNGRFIISEEISHLDPFIPGQHLVVCNANAFEEMILYYLQNEQERQMIAQNAYDFVKQQFTLTGNLKKALTECGLI